MKRRGLYRPTIEDAIEISGIETLHPGGFALTRRTAQVAELEPGVRLLDVSSGRGTQAVYYAQEFGVTVTGVDLDPEMVESATRRAAEAGVTHAVRFEIGDSQALPFEDGGFDVAINECAVGIPDDSQAVLDEMVRAVRPGGRIVIHESTWRANLSEEEKAELAERYGTTPLREHEWLAMLELAGVRALCSELEPWSQPENFWQLRQDRNVPGPGKVLTLSERLRTAWRIACRYGPGGVLTLIRNERLFYRAVLSGKLGYGLYWGTTASAPRWRPPGPEHRSRDRDAGSPESCGLHRPRSSNRCSIAG